MPSPPAWRIAIVSSAILILELAFIRQVPAEVRAISYFTNLLLMAAFFGLGLGCILQRARSLEALLPAGLLLVFGFTALMRGIEIYADSSVAYWLLYDMKFQQAAKLPLVAAALLAFGATATAFVGLGQVLARQMQQHPRLLAYSWDIAGSLGGTILFAVASFLGLPPWIWPPLVMVVWVLVFRGPIALRVAQVVSGIVFLTFAWTPLHHVWSPYYFVQSISGRYGLAVMVNSTLHQVAFDFGEEARRERPEIQDVWDRFRLPYEAYRRHHGRPPESVLILGAGTGNDVTVALANGAQRIVAVEIDPAIMALGRRQSPMRPYDDPRVKVVLDDARHYLGTTTDRFDMVVVGTLDSQTLLAATGNLRLENYVYTRESFQAMRRLLREGGLVVTLYSVTKPWLHKRLHATVREVFGDNMSLTVFQKILLFNTMILASESMPLEASPDGDARFAGGIPVTDDWPYLYLESRSIPALYLKVLGAIALAILAAFVVLRRVHPGGGLFLDFFLLGLGFSLLEAAAIVRMTLVFGTTWIVSAVVFASVLLTIFLANLLVMRGRAPGLRLAWPALLAAVLGNYLVPMGSLAALGPLGKVLVCAALVGVPVFFAAVCFSRLFGEMPLTGYPLGLNLVGAMAGGAVEYVSMLVGMRDVWLVVLALYGLAWLASAWRRAGTGTIVEATGV